MEMLEETVALAKNLKKKEALRTLFVYTILPTYCLSFRDPHIYLNSTQDVRDVLTHPTLLAAQVAWHNLVRMRQCTAHPL